MSRHEPFRVDEHSVVLSPQTRSFRSSDSTHSRSDTELLHTQKTKLPCLLDGLLRKTRHCALKDLFEIHHQSRHGILTCMFATTLYWL